MNIIYIAGKVTGDPVYRVKFAKAAGVIEGLGYTAMNPAVLPENLDYDLAMKICLTMLSASNGICLLDDWLQSPGARREFLLARQLRLPIFTLGFLPKMEVMRSRESDEWMLELEAET